MANPRIFVSSTAYDLGPVRERMRQFILGFGYDAVLSDESDVLYDPRIHTHTACAQEVAGCDLLILVVGGRFGGSAVPEAISEVADRPGGPELVDKVSFDDLSITQIEVLRAIQTGIPIFVFVEESVSHDHHVYEQNDKSTSIVYPSITKLETASFIFEFINFLRRRHTNNAITSFRQMVDIEEHLRKQWAALFQRLLSEARESVATTDRDRAIIEQLEDLKAALLTTVDAGSARMIARGVIDFRTLIEFVQALGIPEPRQLVEAGPASWNEVKIRAGIVDVVPFSPTARERPRVVLVKGDRSGLLTRFGTERYQMFEVQWGEFMDLEEQGRLAVFDAVVRETISRSARLLLRPVEDVDELFAGVPSQESGAG